MCVFCYCAALTVVWLSHSDAFGQIIKNEGVGTLWNGTLPSLILVLNPAVQFMFYEAMKRKAGKGGRKVRGQKGRCVENFTRSMTDSGFVQEIRKLMSNLGVCNRNKSTGALFLMPLFNFVALTANHFFNVIGTFAIYW